MATPAKKIETQKNGMSRINSSLRFPLRKYNSIIIKNVEKTQKKAKQI